MVSKYLVLLRHAKSSWSDPHLDDHDRPLAPRGRRAATRVARYMRQQRIAPDLVLCSSATRARQTLELLELTPTTEVLVEDELYGATATVLLARLRGVGEASRSVLLVGHNPGIQDSAISLARSPEALGDKFPTAGMAELVLPDTAWKELRPGIARLQALVVPKNLTS